MNSNRIEFIDLAKGICILLVVFVHIDRYGLIYFTPRISDAFFSFRMPLYFIISGLFLKIDEESFDIRLFLTKKINRLLIPLAFFTFLTNIYNCLCKLLNFHMSFELRSTFLMAIDESYSGTITWNNGPIFFVFWLFLTYLIVTGLFRLVKRNYALLWLTVLMVGFIGYKFQLPMTLDTAMTCSPFVAFGMTIRNKTNFLYTSYSRIQKFWSILIAFCGIFLLIFFDPSPNYFYCNQYGTSFWGIYVYGIIGTLSILLMAKSINKIKAVNYIGRYSIVILGVHNIMINDLYRLFIRLGFSQYMQTAFVLIIVLFISVSCIYVFTKYIPKLVAQKDLISINW